MTPIPLSLTGTSNHSTDTHGLLTASVTCAHGRLSCRQYPDSGVTHQLSGIVTSADQTDRLPTVRMVAARPVTLYWVVQPVISKAMPAAVRIVMIGGLVPVLLQRLTFTVHDTTTRDNNHTCQTLVATDAQCTECHGTTNVISAALLHNNNCDACHSDATGGTDGTLTGSATSI